MARPLPFSDMGVLTPDLNPTLVSNRGARALVGLGDLYQDGQLRLLPGYTPKTGGPVLANVTNANSATTFSNGSRIVTDTTAATLFRTNADTSKRAYPGDFFLGDDLKLYVIDSVDSDTQLTLQTPYEGPSKSASTSYTIIHRVWMLVQFAAQSSGVTTTYSQDYRSTTSGTFTNTRANLYGVSLTPEIQSTAHPAMSSGGGSYLTGSTGNISQSAQKFSLTAGLTGIKGVAMGLLRWYAGTAHTFEIRIETSSGSTPSGTLAHANAKGEFAVSALRRADYTGTKKVWFAFDGLVDLSASTDYWLVLKRTATGGTWDSSEFIFQWHPSSVDTTALVTFSGYFKWYISPTWSSSSSIMLFGFVQYPTSGTNTYVGPIIDTGSSPLASITMGVSVARGSREYNDPLLAASFFPNLLNEWGYGSYGNFLYSDPLFPDTVSWKLETSPNADMSAESVVVNANTGLTYNPSQSYTVTTGNVDTVGDTVTLPSTPPWEVNTAVVYNAAGGTPIPELTSGNVYYVQSKAGAVLKLSSSRGGAALNLTGTGNSNQYFYAVAQRYFRMTYSLTSSSGASSPLLVSCALSLTDGSTTGESHEVAGVGPQVFYKISTSPTSISTVEIPNGQPAGVAVHQRVLFWTTGGRGPRYWDGIKNIGDVNDLLKTDLTAGVNPPPRADRMVIHNDKLMLYRNVASPVFYGPRASTAQTGDTLTDTAGTWPAGSDQLLGWRIYPDVTNYPLKYWMATASDGTAESITSTGGTMLDVAAAGDTYLITKNYRKRIVYSTETEPADWPTTNFKPFNDEDGDIIQHVESWDGRLIVVCREQVWIVTGYGPTTPWQQQMIAPRDGTLSPWSVSDAGDFLVWWGVRGIMAYNGGYQRPGCITDPMRSIIQDLNESAREQIVCVKYRGLVLWSFPSLSSNVNNKTLLYHPETGRWAVQDFGFYCPAVFAGQDGEEQLCFQDPTTGTIMQLSQENYDLNGDDQDFTFDTSYAIATDPTEAFQGLAVRVSLKAESDMDIVVSWAKDFSGNYTAAGSLEPVDSAGSGRTAVNATDTAYICKLPPEAFGCALSIRLSGAASAALRIMSVVLDTDAQEAATNG